MAPPSFPPLPAPPVSERRSRSGGREDGMEMKSPGREARRRVIMSNNDVGARCLIRETTEEESNFDVYTFG